jgi:hypothetical protein
MTLTDEQRAKVDALVAEKVMGWKWFAFPDLARCMLLPMPKDEPRWEPDSGWRVKSWPHGFAADTSECNYTTSGDAMLEVIEKMRAKKYAVRIETNRFECDDLVSIWSNDDHPDGGASNGRSGDPRRPETIPLHVCLASLSAVGVDWRAELGVKEEAE